MKIIATAALAAATLILTAAVPASADGDHGNRQVEQKSSPGTVTTPENRIPMRINVDESAESDLQQGILPRIVGQLL
ncbi:MULTISPECIES: hypothetical protein [unclassified Streptomyces]|uniref:hypothetical protein n=1 Tax=unclassified Streptomyces TaxID=2593676 RepID=UPI0023662884|nr:MULTISPECIES: hypothetical protein [unclassified Streptomyces]MDF3148910.1 hypothetical protein [Streptomyces sp. T21Q-yed]WDF38967.1 hypothetical protein PBV52_20265 [Streptomyces sp. T12]